MQGCIGERLFISFYSPDMVQKRAGYGHVALSIPSQHNVCAAGVCRKSSDAGPVAIYG
jgi:hypothetical protein